MNDVFTPATIIPRPIAITKAATLLPPWMRTWSIFHAMTKFRASDNTNHNVAATDKLSIGGALMQASRLTSTKGLTDRPIAIRMQPGVRAYATDFGPDFRQSGEIVLANDAHRVAVHELGHHIEFRNPEVKRRAGEFLDRRTAGEDARPLADITNNSNYRPGEIAQSDKFINPYMGKRYNDGSTEIVSMGLEYFHTDPLKLAKDDPDYFMFMYDVLRTP